MRGHTTFIIYDIYMHFFAKNKHIAGLAFELCRWIVYNSERYYTKGF